MISSEIARHSKIKLSISTVLLPNPNRQFISKVLFCVSSQDLSLTTGCRHYCCQMSGKLKQERIKNKTPIEKYLQTNFSMDFLFETQSKRNPHFKVPQGVQPPTSLQPPTFCPATALQPQYIGEPNKLAT